MPQLESEQPRQIIGIVGDVRDGALNQDPGPEMYLPNAQVPDAIQALNVKLTPLAWVVRTRGEPMQLRAARGGATTPSEWTSGIRCSSYG
jgi:putative ABC transport system permease protein